MKKLLYVILAIGLVVYLFFPYYYEEGAYWTPSWWEKCLYNFAKYDLPEGYEMIEYSEGAPGREREKGSLLFFNKQLNQKCLFLKNREFYYTPFQEVIIREEREPSLVNSVEYELGTNLYVIQYLPLLKFLRVDDPLKIPNNLILKGIEIESKETFETPYANVLYIKGTFEKIGFFKKMPFPWQFVNQAFDFKTPSRGIVAIINNKSYKETLFVISQVPLGKDLDESSVREFIQSVRFEKEVYKPALLAGIKNLPKPKVEYGF